MFYEKCKEFDAIILIILIILRGFLELKLETKRDDSPGLSCFISNISKTKYTF